MRLPILFTLVLSVLVSLFGLGCSSSAPAPPFNGLHAGITCTEFWVGEPADAENAFIDNADSAWDMQWMEHYGGVDDPDHRSGYFPAGFTPMENPFYCALPYDDFVDDDILRKASAYQDVPWANAQSWGPLESMCKNHWVKITFNGKTAYAQWEDVGPMNTGDAAYVFRGARPRSNFNQNAGIDASPAVSDYLGLSGMDIVDWEFVDAVEVPDGPWKQIVTTSQIDWE